MTESRPVTIFEASERPISAIPKPLIFEKSFNRGKLDEVVMSLQRGINEQMFWAFTPVNSGF